jgi:hypothetical protein
MRRTLVIVAVLCALLFVAARLMSPPSFKQELTDPELIKLVELYKKYDLPLPPEDAELILIDDGPRGINSWIEAGGRYSLPALQFGKGANRQYLVGTHRRSTPDGSTSAEPARETRPALPEARTVYEGLFSDTDNSLFFEESLLAHAAQMAYLGYQDYAKACLARNWFLRGAGLGQPKDSSLEARMAYLALIHHFNECLVPGSDRKEHLNAIKSIAAGGLVIDPGGPRGEMIHALAKTAIGAKSKVGTIEYEIDQLTELTNFTGYLRKGYDVAAIRNIRRSGIAALPALIDHIDDRRFTRTSDLLRFDASPAILRVGDICQSLIRDITEQQVPGAYLNLTKGHAKAWYEAKINGRLESFYLKRIKITSGKLDSNTLNAISGLAKNYPNRIGPLLDEMLGQRPPLDMYDAMYAISDLPKNHAKSILGRLVRHGNYQTVLAALVYLGGSDPALYRKTLHRLLEDAVKRARLLTSISPEIDLIWHVQRSSEPYAWKQLGKLFRNLRPNTRLEILDRLDYNSWEDQEDSQRNFLRILEPFTRDKSRPSPTYVAGANVSFLTSWPRLTRGQVVLLFCHQVLKPSSLYDLPTTPYKLEKLLEQTRRQVSDVLSRPPPKEVKK